MTTSLNPVARVIRALFVIVFVAFLATGFVLVFSQIAGLIVTNPGLVTWGAETLNAPAVVLASVAGVLAFAFMYFDKAGAEPEEEE
ncbi:MAG: hypothetical protein ACTHZ5_01615 [Micrococcaceae bacterium]